MTEKEAIKFCRLLLKSGSTLKFENPEKPLQKAKQQGLITGTCETCEYFTAFYDEDDNNYYYCNRWGLQGTGADKNDYCDDFYCADWSEK